ncbi:interferon-induced protein 35 isoform X1 [Scophthalmus maximus]|uniref:interferon-induced protein 35 isoform X1 n=1 Tax=Scophthalmus maximus TaxID=52904 RepID=UPI001FA8CCA9|nr:interferon-induced protein 35 isoform X1 [Scophthalmus maximus]
MNLNAASCMRVERPLVENGKTFSFGTSCCCEKETERINELRAVTRLKDFSLVMEQAPPPSKDSLEEIQALIANYKKICSQLSVDQTELASVTKDNQEMTQKCRQRSVKLAQSLDEEQRSNKERIENEKATVSSLSLEEIQLMEEIQKVEVALKQEEGENEQLRQEADVFTTVPEKKVVFTGDTGNAGDARKFEMNSRVVYPMEGGTALITFEDEAAANRILTMKTHQVALEGDCHITVEARPVRLMLPSLVEIASEVCPQRMLISDLPEMDTETLLNKLDIHFHRRINGGGEVEGCEFLPDSGTVVLTFVDDNIAQGLTETEFHEVQLKNKKHTVRVTPFLNGKITNLKTKWSACPRTLLLAGIPEVMEQETLQDLLEIHFQKNSNGGGEIEAVLYNPPGRRASALFESVGRPQEKEQ